VVLVREREPCARWDAHDWHGLFWEGRAHWTDARPALEVVVFGHALLEHLLQPQQLLVGKALVAYAGAGGTRRDAERDIARAIAAGRLLQDPQELRPLPLSGIPGWHAHNADEAFYREAACFRALRPGRRYPPPSPIGPS
jgi:hypothetical protein